jgi:putative spermidine/putrescine transport system substrate-binding protein
LELTPAGADATGLEFFEKKIRPLLPLYPDNLKKQLWLDQKWWTVNGADIGERWNKWMLSKA